MKSYTSLDQSKKLAKILPLESADMCWTKYIDNGEVTSLHATVNYGIVIIEYPCWSLVGLLSVLDFPSLTQNKEDEWEVCVFDHDNDDYIERTASNPIDACVDMILKLHELKLL